MIRVPSTPLSSAVQSTLLAYQREVDGGVDDETTYAERVGRAKKEFERRNRKDNATFSEIRATLRGMCRGPGRCMYCEDSAADEIEHVRPKHLYPESVFVWENFLFACGPCNGPKCAHFAVYSATTGAIVELAHPRNATFVVPEPGDPLFIDPRQEDPMTFLRLELRDTFQFEPLGAPRSREYERATYTIEKLHLNDREDLRAARADAYEGYSSILYTYYAAKRAGHEDTRLTPKIRAIRRLPHPTVWFEMKRQREHYPRLRTLFAAVPEALDW